MTSLLRSSQFLASFRSCASMEAFTAREATIAFLGASLLAFSYCSERFERLMLRGIEVAHRQIGDVVIRVKLNQAAEILLRGFVVVLLARQKSQ